MLFELSQMCDNNKLQAEWMDVFVRMCEQCASRTCPLFFSKTFIILHVGFDKSDDNWITIC